MVCRRKYERLMVDLLAGELTEVETEMLMAHIKGCPKCAGLFKEYKGVIEKSKSIEVSVPESDVWEKKLLEIKIPRPHRAGIKILKPAAVLVSLLLLVSLFFVKMPDNRKDKVVLKTSKNGYGMVLTKLPYTEECLLERIDYIDEESASEILEIVLDTPTFSIYEY
ncbi:MAG: zf-HC2 domain-containing protein [Candidatus Omnitrophica bacterium]|nr:zf-HC2 domain-containing protein [Candidatus Omnitrophota bacterium]